MSEMERPQWPASTSANPILLPNSVIIPEKLDSFINKFAEYTHEKWAFDKVGHYSLPFPKTPSLASLSQDPSFPETLNTSWDPQPLLKPSAPSGFLLCVPQADVYSSSCPHPQLHSDLPLPIPSPSLDPEQLVLWGERR